MRQGSNPTVKGATPVGDVETATICFTLQWLTGPGETPTNWVKSIEVSCQPADSILGATWP